MSWPAPTGEPIRPEGDDGRTPLPARAPTDGSFPLGGAGPLPPVTHSAPAQSTAAFPAPSPGSVPETGLEQAAAPETAIATIDSADPASSGLARISPRTGQPVRPWTVWVSAALLFGGAVTVTAGLLLAMWAMASPWVEVGDNQWTKIDKFNEATWLTAQFPSEPASAWRVFFAIVCCLIAVLVAGVASVVGYYAFAGYRWTRIGALIAVAASALALLLSPLAAVSIGFVALGAAVLWLPATKRFFARWHLLRHPRIAYTEPIEHVFYGPLPRYR